MYEIDNAQMIEQETKDYNITNKIMTNIFQAYDCKISMKQMPIKSKIDAKMQVEKGNMSKKYVVEIKERNCEDNPEYLPMTCKKYCNVMEQVKDNETPLAVYLVNDSEYYIFDLNKIDLNKCEIKNWWIAKVQFTDKRQYDAIPTIFFPTNQCVYNGNYANN